MTNFRTTMMTPPNGEYVFEHGGERIAARTWIEFLPLMKGLMARQGLTGSPVSLAAAYMCPFLPDWFCTSGGVKTVPMDSARKAASPLFKLHVVTPAETVRRLEACRACPCHSRQVCLTCTGIASWILSSFGGRRPALPDDRISGICTCAGTFEMAVASVDERELPAWTDVPDCCWRNRT